MGISLSHSPEKEKKCLSCIIRFGKLEFSKMGNIKSSNYINVYIYNKIKN